ncbi:MAG: hypothetical protein ACOYVF_06695 [Candidatus Zixiibacteriota bacterium]
MEIDNYTEVDTFLNQVGIELKRAQRYRVFISLISIDLSFTNEVFGDRAEEIKNKVISLTKRNIRGSDILSLIGQNCLTLMFPETSRQGAEVTSKRISELIRSQLAQISEKQFDSVIHLEMSSFPDTAGAKTIEAFLEELVRKSRN